MFWVCVIVFILCWLIPCFIGGLQYEPPLHSGRDLSQPVSDEEFLSACSVKNPQVAFKVRKVISDCSGVSEQHIHPQDRLIVDLGME